ncbi:hypothetical protein SAMN05216198_0458 [Halopseudomonas litoralis]|uniref:Uncharacterized protein n=1 Tax=Halopseudomonas litoralis TaxID=797277 RepID=A0A1H1M1J4_9GAMM|nr:hypothetical protein [Halopseudomonas litoralis]SDR80185.1 hypothetical protein SAMN05216198_0458 [Halopseudomonas litoralis]
MRQPDIEIYLKEDFLDELIGWLEQHVGRVELGSWANTMRRGTLHGETAIPLMIVRKAAGKWASIWFESEHTPWATDVDCARAVAAGINREVRCSIGGWQEEHGEANADSWMKVTAEGEEEFVWAMKP